jgi:hypothetical protein
MVPGVPTSAHTNNSNICVVVRTDIRANEMERISAKPETARPVGELDLEFS